MAGLKIAEVALWVQVEPLSHRKDGCDRLYLLLAPHVNDQGHGNDGWLGDYKSIPMLFAQRGDIVLSLACSIPFLGRSRGYVGRSDGWTDISEHKRMTWFYTRAMDGNIAH
ncbi:MAG TPA: hypothetical protein VNE63_00670 [Candidatus Acidoferrales bacterium]|nr:hypothetical protein [Candidatus Acidoferrales bacterium]